MHGGLMGEISGFLLWRAGNTWQRKIRKLLKPYGLTPAQYLLLAGVGSLQLDLGAPVTQVSLARHCGTDQMMTSQIIRVLQQENLVRRSKHKGDGRAVIIEITDKGMVAARDAGAEVEAADTAFHAVLGENAESFADALHVLMGEKIRRRVKAAAL
jgi:DNA-binding MarR family transcriptional regulator